MAHQKRLGFVRQLQERLLPPLNLLLLGLAGVSFALDDLRTAIVISMMVVMSALLSAIRESRSTAAAKRLHALAKTWPIRRFGLHKQSGYSRAAVGNEFLWQGTCRVTLYAFFQDLKKNCSFVSWLTDSWSIRADYGYVVRGGAASI